MIHRRWVSVIFNFVFFFQVFLPENSDLEENTDEDDELREINAGNQNFAMFYSVSTSISLIFVLFIWPISRQSTSQQ